MTADATRTYADAAGRGRLGLELHRLHAKAERTLDELADLHDRLVDLQRQIQAHLHR